MSMQTVKRIGMAIVIFNVILVGLAVWGWAQEATTTGGGLTDNGVKTIGAGLAFLGGAIGTGMAQSRIIAAVLGAVAEDPGQLGFGIFLIAFPETLVILGFVMSFILKG
jgi:V/A-type H+-transporting ATPase subunit K